MPNKMQSNSTYRQKLSLRNLLSIGLESNYFSTNLEVRPRTMYNTRQAKIYQEERANVMTEHKLKRNSSQPKRPLSVEQTEDKIERNKLKLALGKVNILADASVEMSEQERIAAIHKLLQCLSRTENYYKTAFTYICSSFDEFVYMNHQGWPRDRLEFLAKATNSQILVRLFNDVKNITFKEMCYELFAELEKRLHQIEQFSQSSQLQFLQMENKLQEKTQILEKMSSQVSFYEQHPSKEQYSYISELELKTDKLQTELKKATMRIKQLQNSQEYLTQYNNMLSERVEELRCKLYEYEIEQFSGLKQIEKNSDLKQFENNVELLKDLIHKGALRMASMRQEYDKIEQYNEVLLGERSVLAKRAAVGFSQLTPRPNYKKIFEDNGLQYGKILPLDVRPTTEELVIALIKRFRQFYNKHLKSELRLELPQRVNAQKGNPSGPIMEQLSKMGKQLRKVEILSVDVKSGYNKQKEEQDSINKKKGK